MRIKAFTILEIVVTIAITAILVTLVYGAINFLNAQNYREMRTKDRVNEWMILRKQMIEDVYLSNAVIRLEDGMELISGSGEKVVYRVNNGVLQIEEDDVLTTTSFKDASCTWVFDSNDQELCEWTFNVMEESMELSFYAFSTRADRVNEWYEKEVVKK
tara:strand:+ start:29632 stop:30108 length:477 start_codon:yes stop_codon:yes gene_type:complete